MLMVRVKQAPHCEKLKSTSREAGTSVLRPGSTDHAHRSEHRRHRAAARASRPPTPGAVGRRVRRQRAQASSGELRRAQASSAPRWCTPFHLGEQVGHLGEDRVVVVPLEEEVLAWLGLG